MTEQIIPCSRSKGITLRARIILLILYVLIICDTVCVNVFDYISVLSNVFNVKCL